MLCLQGSTENQYSLLSGLPGKILQLQYIAIHWESTAVWLVFVT